MFLAALQPAFYVVGPSEKYGAILIFYCNVTESFVKSASGPWNDHMLGQNQGPQLLLSSTVQQKYATKLCRTRYFALLILLWSSGLHLSLLILRQRPDLGSFHLQLTVVIYGVSSLQKIDVNIFVYIQKHFMQRTDAVNNHGQFQMKTTFSNVNEISPVASKLQLGEYYLTQPLSGPAFNNDRVWTPTSEGVPKPF